MALSTAYYRRGLAAGQGNLPSVGRADSWLRGKVRLHCRKSELRSRVSQAEA